VMDRPPRMIPRVPRERRSDRFPAAMTSATISRTLELTAPSVTLSRFDRRCTPINVAMSQIYDPSDVRSSADECTAKPHLSLAAFEIGDLGFRICRRRCATERDRLRRWSCTRSCREQCSLRRRVYDLIEISWVDDRVRQLCRRRRQLPQDELGLALGVRESIVAHRGGQFTLELRVCDGHVGVTAQVIAE
jgi:hypothetical protein